MNFSQQTVTVEGHASANDIMQADLIYYQRLIREMAIALALDVPLMIYSLLGDD